MNISNARYELTAVKPEQYPDKNISEVALIGRSNVGKSSLINTLLNRKNLARVGGTPGKTRKINFYNVDDKIYIVDLPGYGYAKASKKDQALWGEIADTYLNTRKQLKLIIMLVDIRHDPSQNDILMYNWIKHKNIPHIIAATKSDKIPRSHIKNTLIGIRKTLNINDMVKVIPFSSTNKTGKDEMWDEIILLIK